MKTSSFLFLLNPYVLQSKWTWDEANLTAFFHQPSYPPIIVIFLECRNKTAINSNSLIFTFINLRGPKEWNTILYNIILYSITYTNTIYSILYYIIYIWDGAVHRRNQTFNLKAQRVNTWGFAGHMVSAATTVICSYGVEAATVNT